MTQSLANTVLHTVSGVRYPTVLAVERARSLRLLTVFTNVACFTRPRSRVGGGCRPRTTCGHLGVRTDAQPDTQAD